jgi:hypothetical protein
MPGVDELRRFVVLAVIVGFVGFYLYFDVQVFQAANGTPPVLGEVLVGVAALLAGALGSAFAVALGVTPKTEKVWPLPPLKTILGFGLWAYVLVGLVTVVVYLFNPNETPGAVGGLALTIVGYFIAVLTGAYKGAT